jgi:hypothetical protein
MAIGALAILSLLLDFLQYASGYRNAHSLLRDVEDKGETEGQYDYTSLSYRLQGFCFRAKQVVLIIATVWLLLRIAVHIYRG